MHVIQVSTVCLLISSHGIPCTSYVRQLCMKLHAVQTCTTAVIVALSPLQCEVCTRNEPDRSLHAVLTRLWQQLLAATAGCAGFQASTEHEHGYPAANVVLMDASSFCYRFYHAASRSMSAGGASTAIEHLFLARVLSIAGREAAHGFGPATQLVVVFDSPPRISGGQPIRRSIVPEYKVCFPPSTLAAAALRRQPAQQIVRMTAAITTWRDPRSMQCLSSRPAPSGQLSGQPDVSKCNLPVPHYTTFAVVTDADMPMKEFQAASSVCSSAYHHD